MMRRGLMVAALCVLAGGWAMFAAPATPASATINPTINFEGKLTNTDGTNVTDGTYSIRFRIYNDPTLDAANTCYPTVTTNSCRWEETQASVSVNGGLFQVSLGSGTTLPGSGFNFNTSGLYLGIKVGSDPEMTPRVNLTASPYAFNADLVDGLDSNSLVQLSPGSQQTGNINISGTITSGAVNGVAIGSTIQPSASGALTVQSNGANALTLNPGGAAGLNIGTTNANAITIGNATSNPTIAFNGSGTFGTTTGAVSLNGDTTITGTKNLTVNGGTTTLGGGLTFSGTSARTIAGPGTGGLTISVTSGPLTIGTTTSGTLTIQGAGVVAITAGTSVTIGAVDSTATLFVFDSKNTTGDPAATNGGEYYNSANNKFRCAQNSIWSDCISGFNTITKTADQAATQNSTTMQNDSALVFSVNANTTYVFSAWIPVDDSNTTSDLKYTFTTPASSTLSILTQYYSSATANVLCNITTSGTACADTTVNLANHFIQVWGQVTVAGTAGSVQFQFAQNTATAVSFPVIKKGATLTWHQSN